MWAQLAMMGLNVLAGKSQAASQEKLAKAQYNYEKGAAQNKALANASQNMLSMADASLASYQQRRQNDQNLKRFGEAWSQEAYNSSKTFDALNSRKFNQRIEAAGNLGSIIANAAAAGVGGASVDQNIQAERLRQQRADDAADSQMADAVYARNLNQISMMDNAYNSLTLDGGQFANLNYQAEDNVLDNSWQYKYSPMKALQDGMAGFSGDMNKVGLNLSAMTSSKEKSNTTGFGKASNMLSWLRM